MAKTPRAASREPLRRLVTPEELAEMCQVALDTVYKWRMRGEGPKGFRIGKFLRYEPEAVETWLRDQAAA